ncbi:conjugal transfer protein TrbD [Parachitinimonas caeni]|uniref:Conjugal transfer protein TrbD n=1 Tax=Parachitinimonas caeni TaxID=3031301 RepID=A0ABT7E3L3_9NEIS|nr:conjugal transfer protein TrbD [Parachitinimonas caeni]MDK2126639.1 conjugal transfer protein TrbD [Parachitinimonas caeni]
MEEPRLIPIRRSLNRPHLLLGAERSLVLFSGVITAMVIFSGKMSILSLVVGGAFWACAFWALVRMAKADPQMSQIYQRHIRYRAYYVARACIKSAIRPSSKSFS